VKFFFLLLAWPHPRSFDLCKTTSQPPAANRMPFLPGIASRRAILYPRPLTPRHRCDGVGLLLAQTLEQQLHEKGKCGAEDGGSNHLHE
jgi:hypothetical protein